VPSLSLSVFSVRLNVNIQVFKPTYELGKYNFALCSEDGVNVKHRNSTLRISHIKLRKNRHE